MHRHLHPTMVYFSPTEVADLALIGLKRTAVYSAIKRGHLQTTLDERGNMRISQAEIDRYRQEHEVKRPRYIFRPADPLLWQQLQRERGRAGGLTKAARHSPEEIAEPLQRGRRAWLERLVDPERILPDDERERRVQAAHEAQLSKARMAGIEKKMLRQQFGNEQA